MVGRFSAPAAITCGEQFTSSFLGTLFRNGITEDCIGRRRLPGHLHRRSATFEEARLEANSYLLTLMEWWVITAPGGDLLYLPFHTERLSVIKQYSNSTDTGHMPFLSHPATLVRVKLRIQSTRSWTVKLKRLKIAGRWIGQICNVVFTIWWLQICKNTLISKTSSLQISYLSQVHNGSRVFKPPRSAGQIADTAHTHTLMHLPIVKCPFTSVGPHGRFCYCLAFIDKSTDSRAFPTPSSVLLDLLRQETNCSSFIYICLVIYSIIM